MDGPLILALEAATNSVALTRGELNTGNILAESSLQVEKGHSHRLLSLVGNMLTTTESNWQDLGAIAVSLGPGSFTGLRIGMAAAKGLATALALPLIGVPTLDALAEILPAPGRCLCPVLDARKNQVYAACYSCGQDGGIQRESTYLALEPETLVTRLQAEPLPAVIFGPGAALCQPFVANIIGDKQKNITIMTRVHLQPRAALIGLCAARLLAKGAGQDKTPLVPLYVRASEAELNLRHHKQAIKH